MATLIPFSLGLGDDKKKSALDILRAPALTYAGATNNQAKTQPQVNTANNNQQSPAMNRALQILQQRQPAPIKPQTTTIQQTQTNQYRPIVANQFTANSATITTPNLKTTQNSLTNNLYNPLRPNLTTVKKPELKTTEKTGWKKYYDEEFKKERDSQNFFQRLMDQGSASRIAEQRARSKYANEIINKAWDENGNVKDQAMVNLAKLVANENLQVSKAYGEMEKAKSRAIGASYDSDYKDNRFYATANAIRNMSLGDAILGAGDTQKASMRDVGKFLIDLVPGVLTAPIQGGTHIAEAISGKGTDSSTGKHRDLDALERLGRGASGAIDAAGVFFGGSGEMLNSIGSAIFKKGATETAKQAVKQTSKATIKAYIKAMIEEGAEEGIQQAFEFFGDGGKLITKDGEFDNEAFGQLLGETAQAAALGAVGGGIFKGVGDVGSLAINGIKDLGSNMNNRTAIRRGSNVDLSTNLNTNINENIDLDTRPNVDLNTSVDTNINTNVETNPTINTVTDQNQNVAQGNAEALQALNTLLMKQTASSPLQANLDTNQNVTASVQNPTLGADLNTPKLTETDLSANKVAMDQGNISNTPLTQPTLDAKTDIATDTTNPNNDTALRSNAENIQAEIDASTPTATTQDAMFQAMGMTEAQAKQFITDNPRETKKFKQMWVDGIKTWEQAKDNLPRGYNKAVLEQLYKMNDIVTAYQNGTLKSSNAATNMSHEQITDTAMKAANGDQSAANALKQQFALDDANAKTGDFGKQYTQYSGKPHEALEYLMLRQQGEVPSAMYSEKVQAITKNGNIDFVYGKTGTDGFGLAHIAEKHGMDMVWKLPEIIENGEVVTKQNIKDRLYIQSADSQAVVRLDWDGKEKQWITTAFTFENPATKVANNSTERTSPVLGASEATINPTLSQDSGNVNVSTDFNTNDYVNEQVKTQQVSNKTPLGQRVSETTAKLKHYLVDDAVAYEAYMKGKENKRLRSELREGVDRVRSSDMIARQFMSDNGLDAIGKMSDKALNTFQQYLIAKRAVELDSKGVKTGRDIAADKQLIQSVGNGFAKQEQVIRNYTNSMLDYMTDKGLISSELKQQLIKDNPNYVPFNRVMDEVEGHTGNKKSKELASISKQTVVQKIKGSDLAVDNPIESLMRNTIRMINEGERNDVATKLANTAAFRENILAEGQKPSAGNDTLSFMVDGKKVSYEVPELVAQEMKNLNGVLPDGVNGLVRVLGAPTRMLRTGATSANPMFTLSNLIRDQGQTLITGNIMANIRGMKDATLATIGWGKKAEALRAELNRNGIIGNEYRMTYGYKSGDLLKELQTDNKLSKSAIEKLKHPVETLADVIGKTEYFTRAQQYFGTKGDTVAKSQAARNNTLNFGRGGSVVKVLNKVVPFLNAGVQGGRITVAQLRERPVRTTLALGAVAGLACAVKGIGQAQNKELWDRLGDEEKKQNLVIFTKDTHYNPESNRVEGVIKIPMPQMLYPVLDTANNWKGEAGDALTLAGDIFTAITGLESPNLNGETAEDVVSPVLNQLTPTFAKPFLEVGMNRNTYTGNEIISEYDKNLNPEDKGKKYTTGLARTIAKATGIDAPVVDNFISNWGGGLAQDLIKTMTDNPDNAKDGGGLGAMISTGIARRFLSGSITSQYEIGKGLARGYKNDMKQSDAFRALSAEDQQKVLNAIDTDTSKIASMKAKVEQNRESEITKDLSDRQKDLLANGMDIDEYIKAVTSNNSKKLKINESLNNTYHKEILEKYKSMKSDEWSEYTYKNKSAEYDLAEAKYQNDLANGSMTASETIKREKELRKLKVSKDYDKSVREVYGLAGTKADIQAALDLCENADERAKTVDELNKLNRAMYDAGVITASTYKTRNRNINNLASSSSRSGSGSSSKKKTKEYYPTPQSGKGFTAYLNSLKNASSSSGSGNGKSTAKPTLKAGSRRSNVIGNYVTKVNKTNLGGTPKITVRKG